MESIMIFAQAEISIFTKLAECGVWGVCLGLMLLLYLITKMFVNLQNQYMTTLNTTLMELKTSNITMSGAISALSTEIRTLALMKRKKIDISESGNS
jgi:hypothetical protein